MKKPKGCFKILLLLTITCVALVGLWLAVNFRPSVRDGIPLVRVSPETTILVGPLDANGDVDYLAALNEQLAEGVTPENNAMVKFIEALGPIVEGGRLDPEFYAHLGIIEPPLNQKYYIDFFKWLVEQGISRTTPGSSYDPYMTEWDFAMTAPWKATDFPKLEQWHQRNIVPMETFREGTKRPRYYHPLVAGPGEGPKIIRALLSLVQSQREIARFFSISAMRHLERNEVDEALEDVLAIYRLGQLVRQGPTLVEGLVGIAIMGIADDGITTICASGKANGQQLKDFMARLDAIPPADSMAASLETAERYMCLDVIVAIGRGSGSMSDIMSPFGQPLQGSTLTDVALKTVDWEECMLVVNFFYERLIEAAKIEDRVERKEVLAEFDAELIALEKHVRSASNIGFTLIGGRRAKGRAMGEILIGALTPSLQQVMQAETRCEAYLERAKTLLAITAFKSDRGQFPETLEQLVPEYFAQIPLDPYSNSPMIYAVEENDDGNEVVRLYAVGENGVDDGGVNQWLSGAAGDDWAIEWNIPTWEVFEADAQKGSLNTGFDESEEEFFEDDMEEESDLPPTPETVGNNA